MNHMNLIINQIHFALSHSPKLLFFLDKKQFCFNLRNAFGILNFLKVIATAHHKYAKTLMEVADTKQKCRERRIVLYDSVGNGFGLISDKYHINTSQCMFSMHVWDYNGLVCQ